jgi:CheY-like chemotaxis protein
MPEENSTPRRILVVEDHADTAAALSRLFRLAGHEVNVAPTLADARRLGLESVYDVIFCDIGLPDGNGTEIPALIKPRCPETKLVALTARGRTYEVLAIRAAGFDAHVLKPVEPETLYQYLA